MTLLELAQSRIPDLKKKTAKEWAGPCPLCGGTDRFLVWEHRDSWHCRGCNKSGDAIEFLRRFDGMSCPEAHIALGLDCRSQSCSVADKCRKGSGQPRKQQAKPLEAPIINKKQEFTPAVAVSPEQCWQDQAEKLIDKANAVLLDSPEQLEYLGKRGISREAVEKGKLGWLPENRYPSRDSWGLPEVLKENQQPKKMFIPSGILIPFFDAERKPHRIRIRRSEIRTGDARYYWLQGSGDDVPVIGGVGRRALVVVESDLDAFMIRWQCRDLDVSAIPLGTCGAKPKLKAMETLQKALAILIALDFEPRINPKTEQPENPGGEASKWWLNQFPRAQRWPVPAGKDPGEYFQDHSGDIRGWVLAGLPPAFHLPKPIEKLKPEPLPIPEHARGTTGNGHGYVIAYSADDVYELRRLYPEDVVFTPAEMNALKGMSREDAETMLLVKKTFDGSIEGTYVFVDQSN